VKIEKLTNWIVTVIGVLLVLPLIGVDQIGTLTSGILAWLVAIGVLVIGVGNLIKG